MQRKKPSPKNKARLQPIKVGYPMQLVSTDILGPFPISDNGNSYILVATEYFTRWAEAYPIPDQEAVTVTSKLTESMFCVSLHWNSSIVIRAASSSLAY